MIEVELFEYHFITSSMRNIAKYPYYVSKSIASFVDSF